MWQIKITPWHLTGLGALTGLILALLGKNQGIFNSIVLVAIMAAFGLIIGLIISFIEKQGSNGASEKNH